MGEEKEEVVVVTSSSIMSDETSRLSVHLAAALAVLAAMPVALIFSIGTWLSISILRQSPIQNSLTTYMPDGLYLEKERKRGEERGGEEGKREREREREKRRAEEGEGERDRVERERGVKTLT